MTGFSASDAAIDGFRVIRDHWRLVIGWAVFNLLALVILVVVATIMIFIAAAMAGSRDIASIAGGVIGGLVGGLGTFAVEVMVVAALYRVLLRPQEPGFLYLRLGRDELRLLGVWLIVLVAAIPLLVVGVTIVSAVASAAGVWPAVLVGLLLLVALIWLALRFSLAGPITFAERRLSLLKSWRMTRGRVLPLLGMSVLALCLLVLAAVVGWLALFVLVGAATGFQDLGLLTLSDPDALTTRPGPYLFQLAAQLLFAPVLWVISQAPLAAAYKAFTDLDA
jgi:hypothetical protein